MWYYFIPLEYNVIKTINYVIFIADCLSAIYLKIKALELFVSGAPQSEAHYIET